MIRVYSCHSWLIFFERVLKKFAIFIAARHLAICLADDIVGVQPAAPGSAANLSQHPPALGSQSPCRQGRRRIVLGHRSISRYRRKRDRSVRSNFHALGIKKSRSPATTSPARDVEYEEVGVGGSGGVLCFRAALDLLRQYSSNTDGDNPGAVQQAGRADAR